MVWPLVLGPNLYVFYLVHFPTQTKEAIFKTLWYTITLIIHYKKQKDNTYEGTQKYRIIIL